MTPSQVRQEVLSQHRRLLPLVDAAQFEATRVLEGSAGEGLARMVLELIDTLQDHLEYEEEHIFPVLGVADAWGRERVRHFLAEHASQRNDMAALLALYGSSNHAPHVLAKTVLDFTVRLRHDMRHEERDFLDRRLIEGDLISIEQGA